MSDGVLGAINCETDAIYLMHSADSSSFSEEDLGKVNRGEFIVGNEPDTIEKIKKHNLSVRKIKFWHNFGWPFKT